MYNINKSKNIKRLKKLIPQDKRHLPSPCGQCQLHGSAQEVQGLKQSNLHDEWEQETVQRALQGLQFFPI
jgi:hypothetical protein